MSGRFASGGTSARPGAASPEERRTKPMTDPTDPDRWPFVEGIFHAARALPADERAAFIARACGDDSDLRGRVEELVGADGDWVSQHVAGAVDAAIDDRTDPGRALPAGTRLGPYRVIERLGEGGMGEVHLAEQEEPIRRKVALKLIKLGMDTKHVIARFESERQALALMSHPNVARVFDAGSTERGRPYFAMEYVQGQPITAYCDENRLTTEQRLRLFARVCEGVQHAHQKGIVHRDIKPSNVLVQVESGGPVPKIIDFGVAKATDRRLTEKTLHTQLDAVIGTPAYMSPEQAERSGTDVDTRTDVYSLGVLLYELLVGSLPFEAAGLEEIRKRIRTEEPSRPSTRVSQLESSGSNSARSRGTDPRTLVRALRGDLDWIALRALEKDRTRRYQTPEALAADILRHLAHEPVEAGPPGAGYRFRKFARRNRTLLGAAIVTSLAVLVGLTAAVLGFLEAREESARAEREARKATAINTFLVRDLLAEAAPENNPVESDLTVRTLLDRAAAKLDDAFPDVPEIRAAVRGTVADTYYTLGSYPEAERQWRRAAETLESTLGAPHPDTLHARSCIGLVLSAQGDGKAAETIYRDVLARIEAGGSPEPIEPAFRFTVVNNLAEALRAQGDLSGAETLHVENLAQRREALGPDHEDTLETMNNLAAILYMSGRPEEAEPMFAETWERRRELLGPEHPLTLVTMSNLAVVRKRLGKLAEAEPLQRLALEADRRILGPDHPDTVTDMHNLANLLAAQEKFDEAEELYRETLALRRRVLPDGHPYTASTLEALGVALVRTDRADEAEELHREALGMRRALLPGGRVGHVRSGLLLGECLIALERWSEAEELLLVAWAETESDGDLPPDLRSSIAGRLAEIDEAQGDAEGAERWRSLR